MTDRHTADTINDDDLDQLYDRLARARDAVALHRQGLITTAELYAAIEAGPGPTENTVTDIGRALQEAMEQMKRALDNAVRPARYALVPPSEPAPATADPSPVVLRDPCPHCEGSPSLIPRHAMAGHIRGHHPEEQPMPTTPCTATISGPTVPDDETLTCTVQDVDRHPANHVGPKRAYGNLLWTDHHAGAVAHGASSGEQPSV